MDAFKGTTVEATPTGARDSKSQLVKDRDMGRRNKLHRWKQPKPFLLSLIMMFYQKLMALANELYKDAKPLEGKAIEILNKTYKRLLSKTPTKF